MPRPFSFASTGSIRISFSSTKLRRPGSADERRLVRPPCAPGSTQSSPQRMRRKIKHEVFAVKQKPDVRRQNARVDDRDKSSADARSVPYNTNLSDGPMPGNDRSGNRSRILSGSWTGRSPVGFQLASSCCTSRFHEPSWTTERPADGFRSHSRRPIPEKPGRSNGSGRSSSSLANANPSSCAHSERATHCRREVHRSTSAQNIEIDASRIIARVTRTAAEVPGEGIAVASNPAGPIRAVYPAVGANQSLKQMQRFGERGVVADR